MRCVRRLYFDPAGETVRRSAAAATAPRTRKRLDGVTEKFLMLLSLELLRFTARVYKGVYCKKWRIIYYVAIWVILRARAKLKTQKLAASRQKKFWQIVDYDVSPIRRVLLTYSTSN